MQSLIGRVVNFRYEILEKTGEGDLFSVYRTRDKVLNRLMAVKVLHKDYAQDSEFSLRLVSQARQLINITHPNLVKINDAEAAQDAVYIAEEHVRGINLKERIKRIAPFPVSSAVDVAIGCAQGLEYLHRNGVVHGDFRPQKVLMGPEGEIKVTGAGVALAFGENEEKLTLNLMKRAHYCAPELFQGHRPDERADVYALGVTLFEMLTAAVPFDAETPIAIAVMHARDPVPSPRAINAAVPRAIEGIINKALAKNPADRYQSMREMLLDLRSVQESLRVGRPLNWSPEDPSYREQVELSAKSEGKEESVWKSLGKAALLVALVAAVVFGGVMLLTGTAPPDVAVPNLVGVSLEQAQKTLDEMGLRLEVVNQDYSEQYDKGEIYFTDPQSGQLVKPDSVVRVYVSKGSKFVRIPGVTGLPESEARKVLAEAGILVGDVSNEYSPKVPAGNVISQSPKVGTRVEHTKAIVSLVISLGADPTAIEQTVTPSDTAADSSITDVGKIRKLNIRFSMPADGQRHVVKIVVKDDTGEWTALEEEHGPSEKVAASIQVSGDKAEIITYLDGKEINRQFK